MAQIHICIDTEACTMAMTRDGQAIDHDEFTLGSYFLNDPMDGGSPGSYFPAQYSYFTYSKKMEDGTKANMYGNFKVGSEGSYKERSSNYNLARACGESARRMEVSMALGDALTFQYKPTKKPVMKDSGEVGVPKISKIGDIETKPDSK